MGDTSLSGLRKMDDMVVQVAIYWDALESAKHTTCKYQLYNISSSYKEKEANPVLMSSRNECECGSEIRLVMPND